MFEALNEYEGYALFNEVEDGNLQVKNRATSMANIVQDNLEDGRLNDRGRFLITEYYQMMPLNQLAFIYEEFKKELETRNLLEAMTND